MISGCSAKNICEKERESKSGDGIRFNGRFGDLLLPVTIKSVLKGQDWGETGVMPGMQTCITL